MKAKPKARMNVVIFALAVVLTVLFTAGGNYSYSNLPDSKTVQDSVIYQHGCMQSDKMCTKEECGMENCRPEGGACKEECMKNAEMQKHNNHDMKQDKNEDKQKDKHDEHKQDDNDSKQHNHQGCRKRC